MGRLWMWLRLQYHDFVLGHTVVTMWDSADYVTICATCRHRRRTLTTPTDSESGE